MVKPLEIIQLKELSSADCTMNLEDINISITGINVMDTNNMDSWIKKGEIIIVGGEYIKIFFTEKYLSKVLKKEIGGIITKKRYQCYVKKEYVTLCTMYHVPIIFVENSFSWSDIISPIQSLIIRNQSKMLVDVEHFHRTMLLAVSDKSMHKDICEIFYELIGWPVAIIDENFLLLNYSSGFNWLNYIDNTQKSILNVFDKIGTSYEGKDVIGILDQRKNLSENNLKFFYIPISGAFQKKSYMILKQDKNTETLSEDLLAKIESFLLIYRLKISFQMNYKLINSHYQNIIFEDLLQLNEANKSTKEKISYLLGTKVLDFYRVVMIKEISTKSNYTFSQGDTYFINFKNSLINQKYINDSFLIFSRKNYWILLMPVTNIDLEEFLKSLVNLLDDFYQHSNYFIGVSESHPYWRLSLGYKEAEQSINILVSNYPSKRYLLYSKLGILKMFIDDQGKINQLYRDKMLETYIFPLKETDNKNRTELLSTLETFFYCGFSYSRTSEKLFIHKNTLRARIKRIEQILDVDIKHPDNLMNIYISFQIYHLVTE